MRFEIVIPPGVDWAAWVGAGGTILGAVGTILAILAGFRLAHIDRVWERRQEAERNVAALRERLKVMEAVVDTTSVQIASVVKFLDKSADAEDYGQWQAEALVARVLCEELSEVHRVIPIDGIADERIWRHLIGLRMSVAAVRALFDITDQTAQAFMTRTRKSLRSRLGFVLDAAKDLRTEIARALAEVEPKPAKHQRLRLPFIHSRAGSAAS